MPKIAQNIDEEPDNVEDIGDDDLLDDPVPGKRDTRIFSRKKDDSKEKKKDDDFEEDVFV